MSLDEAYELDPQVALRPEPFGALAYHFGNRRLSFLRSHDMVDVVESLRDHVSIAAALSANGIAEPRWPSFERALGSLTTSGFVRSNGGYGDRSDEQNVGVGVGVGVGGAQPQAPARSTLTDDMKRGLDAPICLTWELTYACNLACRHCLSSSGRRDPRELSTEECFAVIDELERLQVFYVNIGGGEPMIRKDFFPIIEHAVEHNVGVKFSTNGAYIDAAAASRLAAMDYLDVQISIDGADASVNDAVRGNGSFALARSAMEHLADAGFGPFKISIVVTRENVDQLDGFKAIADSYGAQLRVTRLRPSGRGADTWHELHPTNDQQRTLYEWLKARPDVLTGDSFFHLSAFGEALPGLNLCGAGRVVCLIDPVGDVYACPFVIHDEFLAGNVRDDGGFTRVWRESDLFTSLREPTSPGACASCGSYDACQGGCMASKFFVGLQLDDPDPECVKGNAEPLLAAVAAGSVPSPSVDHSRVRSASPVALIRKPLRTP